MHKAFIWIEASWGWELCSAPGALKPEMSKKVVVPEKWRGCNINNLHWSQFNLRREECVRPYWLALMVCQYLSITSMPEQRNNSHWSLSFLVRYRFIGIWRREGKTNKSTKSCGFGWVSISIWHDHPEIFVTHPKKTPKKKTATWVSAWNSFALQKQEVLSYSSANFSWRILYVKPFFAFVYLQNRFIF